MLSTLIFICLTLILILVSCNPTPAPIPAPAPAPVYPAPTPSPAPASTISAPKLISPSNGATGVDLDLTFRWAIKAGTSAKGFELIIARDDDTLSNICRSVSTSPTEYRSRENLEPSTRYYWMVVAKLDPADVDSPVAFSEVWTFITAE